MPDRIAADSANRRMTTEDRDRIAAASIARAAADDATELAAFIAIRAESLRAAANSAAAAIRGHA